MEARLLGMEQRLKQRIEELKETLVKLFIEGVAYDYDEEEGDWSQLEQHRYTGAASANSAAKSAASAAGYAADVRREAGTEDDGAGTTLRRGGAVLTRHSGLQAGNRIESTADKVRTASSVRSESERRTSSSAEARVGVGAEAGVRDGTEAGGIAGTEAGDGVVEAVDQTADSRRTSSQSVYSYRRDSSGRYYGEESTAQTRGQSSQSDEASSQERVGGSRGSSQQSSHDRRTSSRESSRVDAAADAQEGRAIGGSHHSRGENSQNYDARRSGSSVSSSSGHSLSPKASSKDVFGQDAQRARAIGGTGNTEGEDSRRYGTTRYESHRQAYERRTSAVGSYRDAAQGRSNESRAIGGAGYSLSSGSQHSGASQSSSRRLAQATSSSSRGSSSSHGGPPYPDFGPGGGPQQQSWFPGTSRTTVGTGAPDLPNSNTIRTGGFGFGAVGVPLDEDITPGGSTGAQVRAGGGSYEAGDGEVVFRNSQTYADSAEARRPGSFAGGDTSQYAAAAANSSWSSSGARQVTAFDASSASRREGTEVRFSKSYVPTQVRP